MTNETNNSIPEASVEETLKGQSSGAILLDVRESDEFSAGHALGAVSIPLSELGERIDEIDNSVELYVICKSGGRSAQATAALIGAGHKATNVRGGSLEWLASDLPFVSDSGSEPTVI